MNPVIEISQLSKFYGRSRGVEDISLLVEPGDFFGFIGPNGAGKSTTIRLLLNLIFPSSGNIRIFGLDAVKDSKRIHERLGYVPSEASLYDRMKVGQFLRYMASFYPGSVNESRLQELCDVLDLDPDRKITELSTGNKKKVNIIQALLHQPDLLILDEPTTGLDPLIQSKLFTLLTEENKRGVTVFFSSHVLSDVQHLCRKVAIVREGRIIRSGSLAELRDKQIRKVRISAGSEISEIVLKIPGIEHFERQGPESVSFLFSGDINQLIAGLAGIKIKNLTIEELPLEEIFLHYYK